jgi:hypothetical protein
MPCGASTGLEGHACTASAGGLVRLEERIDAHGESTVKKHVLEIFEKLGAETRTAASLRALEVLSSPAARG